MGHGVAAALYTMHLSSLWGRFHQRLTHPADFAATVNNELAKVVKDESFATATCGVIDAESRTIRFVLLVDHLSWSCITVGNSSNWNPVGLLSA